jgi:hypothetical protein
LMSLKFGKYINEKKTKKVLKEENVLFIWPESKPEPFFSSEILKEKKRRKRYLNLF